MAPGVGLNKSSSRFSLTVRDNLACVVIHLIVCTTPHSSGSASIDTRQGNGKASR
jgi:hypothetical protein